MKKFKIILFFLIFCTNIFAQNFSVQAKIDRAQILIGEQCNLVFEIHQRNDIQVVTPIFSDTLISGIEIVGSKIDTLKNQDNSLVIKQTYIVTSFDSALYYIPPFKFASGNDTVFSPNLSLKVLTMPINTSHEDIPIYDIKEIERAPFNKDLFIKIISWALSIWLLIALIIWLVIYYRKKHQPKEHTKEEIKRAAHEIALEKFDEIRKEKIWQQGRSKEYYTQTTDVLREYIENRFDVPTFEKTSVEIIDLLQFIKKDYSEQLKSLQRIFNVSDLVKFAKYLPDFNEHARNLNEAVDFVTETIVKEEITTNSEQE